MNWKILLLTIQAVAVCVQIFFVIRMVIDCRKTNKIWDEIIMDMEEENRIYAAEIRKKHNL